MTTTQALNLITERLVQVENDVKLMEDALDHSEERRKQMQNDIDLIVATLTKLVINNALVEESPRKCHAKKRR